MRHPERAEDYLGHIAEAIERATSYVQPLPDRAAFEENPLIQDAVVRNIEIIGEATTQLNRMAPEFVAQHPELPWQDMRDMRNAVIHAYFNVDFETVWRTVQEDLPKLKQQIDQLLSHHQPDQSPAVGEAYRHYIAGHDTPEAESTPHREPDRDDEPERD